MTGLDEPSHQDDHLGNVAGGPRLHGRLEAAQDVVRPAEGTLIARRHDPERDAFGRCVIEDLVVDVSDVAHEVDVIAAVTQPANEDVERDTRPDVAHVWWGLDRGTAQVDRGFTRLEGYEVSNSAGHAVVQAQAHTRKPIGAPALPSSSSKQIRAATS